MAGADCGPRRPPSSAIARAKLRALRDGAVLAGKKLWR
jgi:hypothetical protein